MGKRLALIGRTAGVAGGLALIILCGFGLGAAHSRARLEPRTADEAGDQGFVDDAGRPIHPLLVAQFLPDFCVPHDDNGYPTITSVDVNTTKQLVSPEDVLREENCVKIRGAHRFLDYESEADEAFSYECLGRTSRGVFVVKTNDARRYSGAGHVWYLFFRLEKSASIAWRDTPAASETTTHLRLVGFRSPVWRRCVSPDCENSHFENRCDRVWTPETRLVGDRLETGWKWEPQSGSGWADKSPSPPPPPAIWDLSNR